MRYAPTTVVFFAAVACTAGPQQRSTFPAYVFATKSLPTHGSRGEPLALVQRAQPPRRFETIAPTGPTPDHPIGIAARAARSNGKVVLVTYVSAEGATVAKVPISVIGWRSFGAPDFDWWETIPMRGAFVVLGSHPGVRVLVNNEQQGAAGFSVSSPRNTCLGRISEISSRYRFTSGSITVRCYQAGHRVLMNTVGGVHTTLIIKDGQTIHQTNEVVTGLLRDGPGLVVVSHKSTALVRLDYGKIPRSS